VKRLLAHTAAAGGRAHPLWCFLANTGLRIGEALALRWANGQRRPARRVVRRRGGPRPRRPGGRPEDGGRRPRRAADGRGPRGAAGPPRERARLAEGYADRGLVSPTATGRPNSERNVLCALKAAARRAGASPGLAPRDFRRVCASLLVASGLDIATAAAILGHKRASVLLDVYARALRGPKRAAAERLQALLYPPAPTATPPPEPDPPPG
jgi:integrase